MPYLRRRAFGNQRRRRGGGADIRRLRAEIGNLRVYNMLIENFKTNGIFMEGGGKLEVQDSAMNDNGNAGVFLQSGSALAYVHNSTFSFSTFAVVAFAGQVTVADSSEEFVRCITGQPCNRAAAGP